MRALVTFGSKTAGTREMARWIAETLAAHGIPTDLQAAEEVESVTPYDAVIAGGALYGGRWQRSAVRFVKRYAQPLRHKRVWFFTSWQVEPGDDPDQTAPVRQVARLMEAIGARGHQTFVARPDTSAAAPSPTREAAEWRISDRVRSWAAQLAVEIKAPRVTAATG